MTYLYFIKVPLSFKACVYLGMIDEGFGHVVNISSIAGKVGSPRRSSYSSAKFAIFGLMDCIRHEVSVQTIKIVALWKDNFLFWRRK